MRVNLITSLSGFPYGTSTAKRIVLIGKSVLDSGDEFNVYSNGIQYNEFNKSIEGEYQGIKFQYLHRRNIKKNISKFFKMAFFMQGCIYLIRVFIKFERKSDVVYSYNHGNLFNVYIIFLSKLFRIKIIQEVNEWYHDEPNRKLEKLIIEGPLVKYSDGIISISASIEKRVKEINPKIKVIRIPVLEEFSAAPASIKENKYPEKYCFWMGDVDGYFEDVQLILKACALLFKQGEELKLYISGPFAPETRQKLNKIAADQDFPETSYKLLGYVSNEELERYCRNAFMFVVPLWNNVRSEARFPTKIASFIQVQKPIISCKIGEVAEYFSDTENILFYKTGDSSDLAEKMLQLLKDKKLYAEIVKNSFDFAVKKFNYKSYSKELNLFCRNL